MQNSPSGISAANQQTVGPGVVWPWFTWKQRMSSILKEIRRIFMTLHGSHDVSLTDEGAEA